MQVETRHSLAGVKLFQTLDEAERGRLESRCTWRRYGAGETVQALVLSVDPEAKRMALSIKQAQASPWSGAADRYPPDSQQVGRVTRIAEFGAFVELETGVEGLVHVSELSHEHIRRPEDVVQVGQDVGVRVLDVDEAGRRISLSIKAAADAAESADAAPAETPKPKKRKHPLRGGLD